MPRVKQSVATYGRHRKRVVALDTWSDSSGKNKNLFSSFNDTTDFSSLPDGQDDSPWSQPNVKKQIPKRRPNKEGKSNKENIAAKVESCTKASIKPTRPKCSRRGLRAKGSVVYNVSDNASGKDSSSDGLFGSVDRKCCDAEAVNTSHSEPFLKITTRARQSKRNATNKNTKNKTSMSSKKLSQNSVVAKCKKEIRNGKGNGVLLSEDNHGASSCGDSSRPSKLDFSELDKYSLLVSESLVGDQHDLSASPEIAPIDTRSISTETKRKHGLNKHTTLTSTPQQSADKCGQKMRTTCLSPADEECCSIHASTDPLVEECFSVDTSNITGHDSHAVRQESGLFPRVRCGSSVRPTPFCNLSVVSSIQLSSPLSPGEPGVSRLELDKSCVVSLSRCSELQVNQGCHGRPLSDCHGRPLSGCHGRPLSATTMTCASSASDVYNASHSLFNSFHQSSNSPSQRQQEMETRQPCWAAAADDDDEENREMLCSDPSFSSSLSGDAEHICELSSIDEEEGEVSVAGEVGQDGEKQEDEVYADDTNEDSKSEYDCSKDADSAADKDSVEDEDSAAEDEDSAAEDVVESLGADPSLECDARVDISSDESWNEECMSSDEENSLATSDEGEVNGVDGCVAKELDDMVKYTLPNMSLSHDASASEEETEPCGNHGDREECHTPSVVPAHVQQLRNDLVQSCRSFKEILTPVRSRTGREISARDKVLLQCEQIAPITFTTCIPARMMKTCVKIGEGVYGEVFSAQKHNQSVALKIIPIEGSTTVNEEEQKSFCDILPEIVISKELSGLHDGITFSTSNFVKVHRVSLVQGSFPVALLRQWDLYDSTKGSENDRPDNFPRDQLFIIFEFENCGSALESFTLASFKQAQSILQQVAYSLAVAEAMLQFEHRDLHWGNVLVRASTEKHVSFVLSGQTIRLPSHGVHVSIIDFTLSRLQKDGCTIFTDLSADPTLFQGKGEYQFDIYRLMKERNGNSWKPFSPYTNVLWLHYLADKLLHTSTCKQKRGLLSHQRQFQAFMEEALTYRSAQHLLSDCDVFKVTRSGGRY